MRINIYQVTNTINGKKYYGQTIRTIKERFERHCRRALRVHCKLRFSRAIKKYGRENFVIKYLSCHRSSKAADAEEQRLIRVGRNNGEELYNIANGGRSNRGFVWGMAQRKHLKKVLTGRKLSVQHKKNISNYYKNLSPSEKMVLFKRRSDEHKNRSNAIKALWRKRISNGHKRRLYNV